MGLLQGSPPHSGRRGGPAAERKQVLARQEIRASAVRFFSIATCKVRWNFDFSPSVSARKQTKVTREAQGLMSGFDLRVGTWADLANGLTDGTVGPIPADWPLLIRYPQSSTGWREIECH